MLPKKSRLKIQEYLGKRGRTFRSPLFTLKAFPSSLSFPRFGAVVGKNVRKTAVGRNALRRMFLGCADEARAKIPPGDYLMIAHPSEEAPARETIYEQLISFIAS